MIRVTVLLILYFGYTFADSEPCWQCEDNLSCVPRSKVCDGKSDCQDSSDETAQCRKLVPDCLPPAFKCDYGACIRGNVRCDGTFDCADGSDERDCFKDGQQTVDNATTTCRPKARELCDGWPHCPDGSDETPELCNRRPPCPKSSYRCAYGACVHVQARCNGLRDCVDGSDELDCYRKVDVEEKPKCPMPTSKPKNSQYSIVVYRGYTWLMYKCEPGFLLTIDKPNHVCLNGRWSPAALRRSDKICQRVRQRSFWTSWLGSYL